MMYYNKPAIFEKVLKNDLCVGCGACIDICAHSVLKIEWNDNGLLIPVQINECKKDQLCLSVCPFNPDDTNTIDDLFHKFKNNQSPTKFDKQIGNYTALYAGHSNDFRETSSSGGISTWIVAELFRLKMIEYAIGVKLSSSDDSHFEYQVITKNDDILTISKTKYYPTTLEGIFKFVEHNEGSYVLTGLPCFLKSVRLFQDKNLIVKERIKYLVGITCGGTKSRFFTEYLAWNLQILPEHIHKPEYRVKTFAKTAGDYSASFIKEDLQVSIKMKEIGDTWGNGMFKPNCCDYCDDIFGDLSDISVGDAWLKPYVTDKGGANLVIVRSNIIDKLIKQGIDSKAITLFEETEERIILSQRANFSHRRTGLQYRLFWKYISGLEIKGKRVKKKLFGNLVFIKVQLMRMNIRAQSFEIWKKQKNDFERDIFNKNINKLKKHLAYYTKLKNQIEAITDTNNYFKMSWYYKQLSKIFKFR